MAAGVAALSAIAMIQSNAQLTYVDAVSGLSGNTTLANGNLFSPPLNGTTALDNNWELRTPLGAFDGIFESRGENFAEDAPEIRTTISGLTPGAAYAVYVNFWDPTSNVEDWNVRAGFSSNPGANTLFSNPDAIADLGGLGAGSVLASTFTYSFAPDIFLESSRDLRSGSLGIAIADGSGQIAVYVDDNAVGAANVNRRTWYDGVSFLQVPEPSSFALAALGLAGIVMRRRQVKA